MCSVKKINHDIGLIFGNILGFLTKGNEKTDAMIVAASIYLLEKAKMLHQQFYLSTQNLHKFLSELLVSQYKHLSRSYTTCVSLTPLGPPLKDRV